MAAAGTSDISRIVILLKRDEPVGGLFMNVPGGKQTGFVSRYCHNCCGVRDAVAAEYMITDHVNTFVSVGDDTDDLRAARFGVNYTW